jgi:hypothetical protein
MLRAEVLALVHHPCVLHSEYLLISSLCIVSILSMCRLLYLVSLFHPLQAGYEHYELSNYALPGHACAHNLTYWQSRPFYGFGLGAASLLGGQRLSRPRAMSQYRRAHWPGRSPKERSPSAVPCKVHLHLLGVGACLWQLADTHRSMSSGQAECLTQASR